MKVRPTPLAGLSVVQSTPFDDHRGVFARLFCVRDLASLLGNRQIVQINLSKTSAAGAIRGLHFQAPPHAEIKMVRCLRGRVFDVVADLREGSPTFLRWHSETLSPDDFRMMIVPEGCAHGFQALEPDSELLYFHTAFHSPQSEGGVKFDDPRLDVSWPLEVVDVSERDRSWRQLSRDFRGIRL